MKIEELIIDKINNIEFCKKFNFIFYDYFKANNLPYIQKGKYLALSSTNNVYKKTLQLSIHFSNDNIFFNFVIRDNWHLPFSLSDYFEKTNPINKDKLIIANYQNDTNDKLNIFFIFLNEILNSSEIKKLITTNYWTEKYYIDMWGDYK